MSKKRVYAALEIADCEIRLLVFEVLDGRMNVLRVERVPHNAIKDSKIVDEPEIVRAIQQATGKAQDALGYRIERVLLAIPSLNARQSKKNVRVQLEKGAQEIRLFHIQQGYKTAITKKLSDDLEMINVTSIDYKVDGKTSKKLPIGKEAKDFVMEVRMAYADKEILYSYVHAIEQANLEVLDLYLDSYAAGLESGAVSNSTDFGEILIILEADHTTLAYFDEQKMMNVVSIDQGYSEFIRELQEKYHLSNAKAYRLLTNLFAKDEDTIDESIIYIDQTPEERIEISTGDLHECVDGKIEEWIQAVDEGCKPLFADRKARYIITGQGANIPILEVMKDKFSVPTTLYRPSSIGARDDALTSVIGLGYAWQNQNKIIHDDKISVNNNELESSLDSIRSRSKSQDGSFTKKIKTAILGVNE